MADRPIIFSASMVRALLAGRKTQTRRIIKPRKHCSVFEPDEWTDSYVLDPGNASWRVQEVHYEPGDRLWVRERWAVGSIYDGIPPRDINPESKPNWCGVRYAATDERHGIKDRPSIHMPRWVSRLTLDVTDVRVQRLQDISEEDAESEGLWYSEDGDTAGFWFDGPEMKNAWGDGTVECFRRLWEHLHGEGSWAANPWIVTISFDVHHGNIDNLPPAPSSEPAVCEMGGGR